MSTSHAKAIGAGRLTDRLRRSLRSRVRQFSDRPGTGLVSVTLPADGFSPSPHLPANRDGFFWSRRSSGIAASGTGIAARISCRGGNRFAVLEEAFRELRTDWAFDTGDGVPPPMAFLGFAFSRDEEPGPEWHGLGNTELIVPEIAHRRLGEREWLTFSATVGAGVSCSDLESRWLQGLEVLLDADRDGRAASPDPASIERVRDDGWSAPIDDALQDIHAGRMDKVVLTRRVRYRASRPLMAGRVLDGLIDSHSDGARFCVTRGGFALIGVSPERLLSLSDGTVVADALAGTAPRGSSPDEDRGIADRLRRDPKALEEHGIVVDQIRAALDSSCSGLVVPQSPGVMSLPTVHHLWSPVRGHLRNRSSLLELADRLHPTPAVGGSPRHHALSWLAQNEHQGRGWYTGGYGWLDTDGDGELSVVLRCGIVNGVTIDLFAGAGIVAGSDAAQEMAETEWKLRTMRGALDLG